ncbi:MAG: type II secretion system F family protein [Candidatus Gastranaerophilales bacterium]|nr:type II secretion system F family protein [Candidatus Gastranaerophilales bacterium]
MSFETIIRFCMLVIMALMCGMLIYIVFNRDNSYLLERLKRGHAVRKQRNLWDDLLDVIKPLTVANMKDSKNTNTIKQMFIKLGLPANENDIMDFENRRILRLLIVALLGVVASFVVIPFLMDSVKVLVGVILVCFPTYLAYKSPAWALAKRIKKKEKAFEKFFPDAIDLLCVCVEAGLSIDSAIERVGREFSNFSKEVGSEFSRIAKDMLSGVSKQDALRGLTERVENKDIQSFVAVIVQADKLGASISSSLSISADSLRTKRKQRLDAQVSAASTKMTIPLVLCLLPATFAVVLTPAIIQVVESLGKMHGFK